jgi:hypothetical protein
MALTKERVGEIAWLALQRKYEDEGFTMKPNEIKRDIANEAKKLGIPPYELAQFAKLLIEAVYKKTIGVLDTVKEQSGE